MKSKDNYLETAHNSDKIMKRLHHEELIAQGFWSDGAGGYVRKNVLNVDQEAMIDKDSMVRVDPDNLPKEYTRKVPYPAIGMLANNNRYMVCFCKDDAMLAFRDVQPAVVYCIAGAIVIIVSDYKEAEDFFNAEAEDELLYQRG